MIGTLQLQSIEQSHLHCDKISVQTHCDRKYISNIIFDFYDNLSVILKNQEGMRSIKGHGLYVVFDLSCDPRKHKCL